ncbi:hypothetical protein QWY16_10255 [Planococcus shenhongbingii]|uniref:hypothetical protein n=1 Tax=Planococcus shenhongbingii TaxID=3058398 RepID=UPI002611AD6E|nr:hypothetical protein [Planococcus sp. N016]WKA56900.1 hypothetical protein QWY16_10255 [Planococcus sp. N016]
MERYICETCGMQYENSAVPPSQCKICNEERQYINPMGQSWTTLECMMKGAPYKNWIAEDEEEIHSIVTKPSFAIGQTAYLVREKGFNLLWDCITYIDPTTIEEIKDLGGVDAIAISHPHYYASQVEWADAFNADIYIHEDDRQWVTRQSEKIIFWSGQSIELHEGLILHKLGGHFKGATVLECQKGIIFSGDIVRVTPDFHWVTFMYSYPNFIPLPASTIQRMADYLNGINYYRIYDAFHRIIKEDADEKVQKSAQRYIDALNGNFFST